MTAAAWTPEVVAVDLLKAAAAYCPRCKRFAVVPLTRTQRAAQPDATTHVCHPTIGGCNTGFEMAGFAEAAQ